MLIKKKVIFLLILIIALPLVLTGCYDLGDATEDDEDYCETYAEIRLVDSLLSLSYYKMEDFYNKEAVNDLVSPMDEEKRSEYSYLMIKVDKDLSLGALAIHFDSTVRDTVSVSLFVMERGRLPTKIYTGLSGLIKREESDEPDPLKALATATCELSGNPNDWGAVMLSSWVEDGITSKRRDIKKGQYIVLRINNNCYDPARYQFDDAEEAYNKAEEEYRQKAAEWQTVNNDPSATQEQRNAAMTALNQALAAKNVAERDYEDARIQYEKNKFPYGRMPVRMTAILINAE